MRSVLWRRFDWILLALVLLLSGYGILMIASALSGNPLLQGYYLPVSYTHLTLPTIYSV